MSETDREGGLLVRNFDEHPNHFVSSFINCCSTLDLINLRDRHATEIKRVKIEIRYIYIIGAKI